MPVTPASRPLPPNFGGATCHGFHQKYPPRFFKMTVGDLSPSLATTASPSFFTLLFMAWICWMNALRCWFPWLLFQEGENRHHFQPNFEAHQQPIPLSPFQGQGSFVTQATQRPYTNFTLHHPQCNYQGPCHMHIIPANKFHQAKIQAIFILQHSLFRKNQPVTFRAKTSPQRHLQAS